MLRIARGITGCGDQIEETFAIMKDLSDRYDLDVKVYLSKNGELEMFPKPKVEVGANSPFIAGEMQMGKFSTSLKNLTDSFI